MTESIAAIESRDVGLFRQSLRSLNVCDIERVFTFIITSGDIEFLNVLLETELYVSYSLSRACVSEQLPIVKRLLRDSRYSTEVEVSRALGVACRSCHLPIVKQLLKQSCLKSVHGDVDSLMRAHVSHIDPGKRLEARKIIYCIIQDSRFDPSFNQAHVFRIACMLGLLNLVEIWLRDPRIHPAIAKNFAIKNAAHYNRHLVVDRLLLDPRIDSMSEEMPNFDAIAMIRSRAMDMCIGLQDLSLPALVTLEILDAMIPNSIALHYKWKLICSVWHFKQ